MVDRKIVLCGLLCLAGVNVVSGWGGLFNRFNPSMLNNFGYGAGGGNKGGYGNELFGVAQEQVQVPDFTEAIKEQQEEVDDDPCIGKSCTANEHCCEGHVCVDTEDSRAVGNCLPVWGKKQGEVCYRDNDCESGFLCLESAGGRSCQAPIPGERAFGDDCRTSSDCNIAKGLCCKLQRRPRNQPKKICTYFTDPMTCIGPVAASQVMSAIEHTAGEKRVSGHPDDFLHLRK